jgi:hypothetical protein
MTRRAVLLGLLVCAGCATRDTAVSAAFPVGSVAAPWVLQGETWSGTFDEAAPALGSDAETWRKLTPTRVWLAVYAHESQPGRDTPAGTEPGRYVKVRCFAFATVENACAAYRVAAPVLGSVFQAGEEGCWTDIGVLYRWGRLVFDIFGDRATWASQVQASYLSAVINRQMPPGAPANPQ